MDKLQLTERALGRVYNFRSGCMCHTMHLQPSVAKQPNLELKTQPKQLLGSLPRQLLRSPEERLFVGVWTCGRAVTGQREREITCISLSLFPQTSVDVLSLPLFLSLSFSLTGQKEREKGREKKRNRNRKRGRERKREGERERRRERERERKREREREIFNGMTGALAPFSYLV